MLNMYEFRKVSSSQRNAQNQSMALDETRRRRPLPVVFEHEHFNRENPQLRRPGWCFLDARREEWLPLDACRGSRPSRRASRRPVTSHWWSARRHLIIRRKRKKTRDAEAKQVVVAEAQYQSLREPISELESRLHGLELENSELAERNKQLEGRLRELELENAFLRSRDLDLHLP